MAVEIENTERAAALTSEMVRVGTPASAARAALRFCYQRFRVPVAAWIGDGHRSPLTFSGAEGLGTRKRMELRTAMPRVEAEPSLTDRQRSEISRRFREVTGAPRVEVVDAGQVVLVAGGVIREDEARLRPWLEILARLLADVLRHIEVVDRAKHRNQYLDLGIAWTAHELQGPLHATRATIERLLRSEVLPANEGVLARCRDELARLAELVDSVLRWSVGRAVLQRTPVDVGGLIRLAADAVAGERGEDRIRIRARGSVMVNADPVQLSVATANLIRNALNYSPPGSEVLVSVQSKGDHATITVTNEGPGIPPDEMKSIFDPLVRGRTISGGRPGNGLGLFVAKQVIEGHGGRIWLESGKGAGEQSGTVFRIRLALASPGPNGNGGDPKARVASQNGRSADVVGIASSHPRDMSSRAGRGAPHA